ncbi:DUF1433 domain-containing protein [Bacillus subtilis]|nr:DUF1433 domain-containing protein [Bacillus subtilis]MEC0313938.1 DUF1433 domain-containing protein [Bacillus subtilis]MEC0360846.1 DUF1433 domain-containing protein [Bacillus subtilis]MED3602062.1 DUF1433 domain-containing protein [Bacillus subtilis]MED3692450.1 DUF1433 domain-containing protein [Bacillus subtilis]
MKKKKYIIILILIIIAVGGFIMKYQHDQKEKEIAFVKEAQEHMEKFLYENYKGVKDVSFSDDYYISPMGGIRVEGYLNGDKESKFQGIYDPPNKEIQSYTIYDDEIEKTKIEK